MYAPAVRRQVNLHKVDRFLELQMPQFSMRGAASHRANWFAGKTALQALLVLVLGCASGPELRSQTLGPIPGDRGRVTIGPRRIVGAGRARGRSSGANALTISRRAGAAPP